ncbi:MAG TPA: Maf family protein [Verrucomicrobiales bacterium]|nr:Maf family protein [Verrucomicrobiales bacterium]
MPPEPGPAIALILASASPRRRELLECWGYGFEVAAGGVVETHDPGASPAELTVLNALRKARAVAGQFPEALVLGADTLVYLGTEPLGKPADLEEAAGMLRRLSGKTHEVCTGVALVRRSAGLETVFHDMTRVTFRRLSDQDICYYLERVDPLDKAGGYALQEHGVRIVAQIEGSWSNVVGLPMESVVRQLERHGFYPDPARGAATPSSSSG